MIEQGAAPIEGDGVGRVAFALVVKMRRFIEFQCNRFVIG